MAESSEKLNKFEVETQLVQGGRAPDLTGVFVNPPVIRASTSLFPNTAALKDDSLVRYTYGLNETPTIEALSSAINLIEEAAGTVLLPSGLAAITTALLSATSAGDHLLIPDNAYGPARRFCDQTLSRFGVEIEYYDPLCGDKIESYFKANTAALLMEAPGSHTFEMPDLEAFVKAAHKHNVTTLIDNTWATPLIFKPVPFGIDYSIQAGTKYFSGHSDALIGHISTNEKHWPQLKTTHKNQGVQAGTEEMYLTMRGMRTMALRLQEQEKNALKIAKWLKKQPGVKTILHPALPDDPGHKIWKETMGRSSGLFGFVLDGMPEASAAAFLDSLELFGLGYSWGGFESLAVLTQVENIRTATRWNPGGPTIRLNIGLENPKDLKKDIKRALDAAHKAAAEANS